MAVTPLSKPVDAAVNGCAPVVTTESIHSLDLPQLHRQPSFSELCKALDCLKLAPPSWNGDSRHLANSDDAEGISRYLTKIIGSDLHWLLEGVSEEEGEERTDLIHELASKRLAERCGRSAMPEMVRTWNIPRFGSEEELRIELCEPPFAGDSLGLKTWGTSFVMAKKLEELGEKYFGHLLHGSSADDQDASRQCKVLELGSGTGLLGLTAALLWGKDVVLTDLPEIVPNLQVNLGRNGFDENSNTNAKVLDWSDVESSDVFSHNPEDKFEIILVSDPFYDTPHPKLLAQAIPKFLKEMNGKSRILVSVPLRDNTTRAMQTNFEEIMKRNGYGIIAEGNERCFDDWDDLDDDEEDRVYCWWSIWKANS